MNEEPSTYQRWVAIGSAAGLLCGAAASWWEPMIFGAFPVMLFMHVMVFQHVWRVAYFRAIVLGELGVAALWLAMTCGAILAKSYFDDDILIGAFIGWAICAAGSLLLLLLPRTRVPPTERAPLRDYVRFNLRGLFLLVTVLAVLFGLACMTRGYQRVGWQYLNVNTSGRSASQLVAGRQRALEPWLRKNGYQLVEAPDFAGHVNHDLYTIDWYKKESPGRQPVFVKLVYHEHGLFVETYTLLPRRAIPLRSPQEVEAERAAHELLRVWEEFELRAGGR